MFGFDPGIELTSFLAQGYGDGSLRARAAGSYLGLAVGDALGATVKFLTPQEIRARYGEHREMRGGGWLHLRRGQVTDETEMSLALGRSILEAGKVDPSAVAGAFSAWMGSGPVDICHRVQRCVVRFRQTGDARIQEDETGSGNGACMRCLPVALAYLGADDSVLAEASRLQSHVTHNNPLSDLGTLMVIRMVQSALVRGDRRALKRLTNELVAMDGRFNYDSKRMEDPNSCIVDSLRVVFQSLFATGSFEGALVNLVNRGGDADSTGAILGMIAGALYGVGSIPQRWVSALDEEVTNAVLEQSQALLRLSPLLHGSG